MRIILLATFLMSLLFNNLALASESNASNLIALDENTFVKISKSNDVSETIQLFKIKGNQINLVDAIQIEEKKVNFKSLYEYKKLSIDKIEQK